VILLRAWRPGLSTGSIGIVLGLAAANVFTHNIWPEILGEIDTGVLIGAAALASILMLTSGFISARQALAIEPGRHAARQL